MCRGDNTCAWRHEVVLQPEANQGAEMLIIFGLQAIRFTQYGEPEPESAASYEDHLAYSYVYDGLRDRFLTYAGRRSVLCATVWIQAQLLCAVAPSVPVLLQVQSGFWT